MLPKSDVTAGRTSPVFRFFVVIGDKKKCIQDECRYETEESQASNMEKHLKSKHSKAYAKLKELKLEKSKTPTPAAQKRSSDVELVGEATRAKQQKTIQQTLQYARDDVKQVRLYVLFSHNTNCLNCRCARHVKWHERMRVTATR
jgi:hypothetical protein